MIAVVEAKSTHVERRSFERFSPTVGSLRSTWTQGRTVESGDPSLLDSPLNSERQAIRLLIDAQSATQLKLQEELVAWRDSSYRLEKRVRQLGQRLAERDRFDRLEEVAHPPTGISHRAVPPLEVEARREDGQCRHWCHDECCCPCLCWRDHTVEHE
jgi:hypothetical protein